MSNDEIVEILELTTKLLELHDADTFKIRTYSSAAFNLSRLNDQELATLSTAALTQLPGVGKSMAAKIQEIVQTGRLNELEQLMAQTPVGVLEMFKIKGIGAKKIGTIWRQLGIDTIAGLQIACETGQIAKLKGFGESTQQKILASMAFLQSQMGKVRMDKAAILAELIRDELQKYFPNVVITGEVARKNETVETIQLLVGTESPVAAIRQINEIGWLLQNEKISSPFTWRGKIVDRSTTTELPPQGEEVEQKKTLEIQVEIVFVYPDKFESERFILESTEAHLSHPTALGTSLLAVAYSSSREESAEAIYQKAGLPYVVPEMREGLGEFEWLTQHKNEDLITWDALRGILHNHSTYSDGKHSLEVMARYCQELGFEYLGIADHSQTASYANGLRADRVKLQHEEIDRLNQALAANASKPFKILKGIESDILGDGSLDYPEEVLKTFDYVVASVHSNLTMSLEKATGRLLAAIENPYTTILGHPTGRLLLAREGYPIDHKVIIEACARHGVVIEINASPWRLDLDWRWIRYCMDKGVMLSINPDAHQKEGYFDMHYGVNVARKGGLTKEMTFNVLSLAEIEAYLDKRKKG
ncbi:DNA polymerase/3'-5' exonuclease PolX [Runella salmonicolor]|uniref:Helix-hairpin-helix domain-containing protein n=1 Tax=Runella salmonicolor TaxID=2950278 RepID=A0ABT1FQ95_9BACT|nr:DNA polymerase/3'-5' exonuclease PolX [Runella salmonicolor]MCP1382773.1 helix-hairpin-helix domain-containing protein [Runella salmonicolor]